MNNKKNLEIFKTKLNDFSDFKDDALNYINDHDDNEYKKVALDYISRITSCCAKSFEDFNFLDLLNNINEFGRDMVDIDLDLSYSMFDKLQDALYHYIYNELVEKGISKDHLDHIVSLEDIHEGSWGVVNNSFWIESNELLGEVINYTINSEILSNDELLIESLDSIVDSIYTKLK